MSDDSTRFSLSEQPSKSSPNQISFFTKLTIAPLILSPSNSASDKIAQSSQTKHFFVRKISHYPVNDPSNDSSKHDNIRNMEIVAAFGNFILSANGKASFFSNVKIGKLNSSDEMSRSRTLCARRLQTRSQKTREWTYQVDVARRSSSLSSHDPPQGIVTHFTDRTSRTYMLRLHLVQIAVRH